MTHTSRTQGFYHLPSCTRLPTATGLAGWVQQAASIPGHRKVATASPTVAACPPIPCEIQ
ncbi:hypothetical protein JYQ62_02280 [Nostoc sp. UHCC 0702]|nr:hypothetical protein JYQ62_02280 [Nostoc sp. UHCC 0702]